MKGRILALLVCILLFGGILSVGNVSATDKAILTITIYKIEKEDSVGSWIDGEADWSYRLWVDDGKTLQDSGWVSCGHDIDNPLLNLTLSYDVSSTQISIKIALKNTNVIGEVLADISSKTGGGIGDFKGTSYGTGARYEGTWNLATPTLTGDQTNLVNLGGKNYYWISGSFDGSHSVDEYDASIWFDISDNYSLPVANAGYDKTVNAGDKVNFDGSRWTASVDIVKYQWDYENDGIWDAEGATASYTYNTAGTYTVALKITDSLGMTSTDTLNVKVKTKPTSAFVYSPSTTPHPTTLDTIQFTDTSTIIGGTLTSWHWDFGDGATSTDRNPTHKYSQGGSYAVTLRVTGNDGEQNSNSTYITVIELANIIGIIKDAQGNPINGVTVSLYNAGTTTALETATTDSSGAYTISDVATGSYDIQASKTGYNDNKMSYKTISSGENKVDFVLTSSNGGGTPGFELIIVICAIALLLFWKRKNMK